MAFFFREGSLHVVHEVCDCKQQCTETTLYGFPKKGPSEHAKKAEKTKSCVMLPTECLEVQCVFFFFLQSKHPTLAADYLR